MVIGFGFVCTFVTVALLSLLVRGTNSGGLVGVKSKLNSGFVVRVAVTRVCCGRYIVNSKRGTGINGGTTYSAGALTIYKAIVARHKCQAKLLCLRLPFARTVFVLSSLSFGSWRGGAKGSPGGKYVLGVDTPPPPGGVWGVVLVDGRVLVLVQVCVDVGGIDVGDDDVNGGDVDWLVLDPPSGRVEGVSIFPSPPAG